MPITREQARQLLQLYAERENTAIEIRVAANWKEPRFMVRTPILLGPDSGRHIEIMLDRDIVVAYLQDRKKQVENDIVALGGCL